MDDDLRKTLVARLQRAHTPLERYKLQLDVLHYDMEQSKVWNDQLTREFSLRKLELEQTYVDSQISKARWT